MMNLRAGFTHPPPTTRALAPAVVRGLALAAGLAAGATARAEPPVISEAQWRNALTVRDEEGDSADWVEIRNPGPNPVNLGGYRLVENETEFWSLPGETLEGYGYRLIFASGKNRAVTGSAWHASFALQAGDRLRLESVEGVPTGDTWVLPDGPPDSSWGLPDPAEEIALVTADSAVVWSTPAEDLSGESPAWAERSLDDSSWTPGQNGILVRRERPGLRLETWGMRETPLNGRQLRVAASQPRHAWRVAESAVPTLNFAADAGTPLDFPGDDALPARSGSPVTLHVASGLIRIPAAGTYTLAVNSSAGYENPLRYVVHVDNQRIDSGDFGGSPIDLREEGEIDVPGPDLGGAILHPVTLERSGFLPLQVWWVLPEDTNQAFEVSIASGTQDFFNASFQLLGDGGHSLRHANEPDEAWIIGSDISAVFPPAASGFVSRIRFNAPPATHPGLRLRVRGADGFRAWIDGRLVAQQNAPVPGRTASRPLTVEERALVREVDVPLSAPELGDPGEEHVLTVQTLAAPGHDSLLYQMVELVARSPLAASGPSFLAKPTPGRPNAEPVLPPAVDPQASPGRGVHTGPVVVTLSHPDPAAEIYFTTDGTAPLAIPDHLYSAPIPLEHTTVLQAFAQIPGGLPSRTILHTYLLPETQGGQAGDGLPATWGSTAAAYGFNPESTRELGPALVANLRALPAISLHLPADVWFGPLGLHPNSDLRGDLSAYDGSAEFLYPRSGVAWRESVSLRVKGEASRSESFLKHGFRLDFGAAPAGLRRPVLEGTGRTRYNTLMLHGSFVDNLMTLGPKAQYIRDLWVRDTLLRMGHPAAHGNYFHLYLNGLYWGLYHAGERCDATWCAEAFGGSAADWDVIDSDGVISGSDEGWPDLLEKLLVPSPGPADYEYLAARLDLDSFCDYMLVNLYAANTDWPSHNWYAAKDRRTGVWRMISWDAEYSFDRPGQNLLPEEETSLGGAPGDLLRFLSRFPSFRDRFSNRVRLHCTGDGALTPARAEATWLRRAGEIESAIAAEYARWSGLVPDFEGNFVRLAKADWDAELDRLRTTWFPARTRTLTRQLRAVGLYAEVQAPVIAPNRPFIADGQLVTLANTGSNAELYYTTDGSDPRGADGQPSPLAIPYTVPFAVNPPVLVQARGWYDGEASPLLRVQYWPGVDPSGLRISEVSFRPTNGRQEFIEIMNRGDQPVDLAGIRLEDAVDFTFPAGVILAPGAVAVVARDTAAFQQRYPDVAAVGEYEGALADEGERLLLTHPLLGILDQVAFRPFDPWMTGSGSLHRREFTRADHTAWGIAAPLPGRFVPADFWVTPGPVANGRMAFSFPVESAWMYELQVTAALDQEWRTIQQWSPPHAGSTLSSEVPAAEAQEFFRVVRTPVP